MKERRRSQATESANDRDAVERSDTKLKLLLLIYSTRVEGVCNRSCKRMSTNQAIEHRYKRLLRKTKYFRCTKCDKDRPPQSKRKCLCGVILCSKCCPITAAHQTFGTPVETKRRCQLCSERQCLYCELDSCDICSAAYCQKCQLEGHQTIQCGKCNKQTCWSYLCKKCTGLYCPECYPGHSECNPQVCVECDQSGNILDPPILSFLKRAYNITESGSKCIIQPRTCVLDCISCTWCNQWYCKKHSSHVRRHEYELWCFGPGGDLPPEIRFYIWKFM